MSLHSTEGWVLVGDHKLCFPEGRTAVLASTIPAHALYFSGYEFAKKYIFPNQPVESKGPVVHFLAGLWAEVCGATIWVPMVIPMLCSVHCRGCDQAEAPGTAISQSEIQ